MDKQHADGRSCAWPGVWQSWSLRSRFFLAAALALCVTVLMVVLLLQSALTSADQQERVQRYELPAQLQSVAARVQAQLNLATRLQTTDKAEIGRMCEQLNRFLERLHTAFRDVRTSVNAIHANAGSIARGNQDLAQRTETEVAALEHSASSMEELATSVQQNAETAHMALVDEVAAAAAQLEAEATRLHDLMGAFHLEQNSTMTLALR